MLGHLEKKVTGRYSAILWQQLSFANQTLERETQGVNEKAGTELSKLNSYKKHL